MTIEHPGLSRRTLLSTVTLGVPALGLLGAANLIGAPAASAKKTRITLDGWWGHETTTLLQAALGFPQTGVIDRPVHGLGLGARRPRQRCAGAPGAAGDA